MAHLEVLDCFRQGVGGGCQVNSGHQRAPPAAAGVAGGIKGGDIGWFVDLEHLGVLRLGSTRSTGQSHGQLWSRSETSKRYTVSLMKFIF
jgi:hypothetical protein